MGREKKATYSDGVPALLGNLEVSASSENVFEAEEGDRTVERDGVNSSV